MKKTNVTFNEWAKHLRPFNKRRLAKKVRAAAKKLCFENLKAELQKQN